MDLSVIGFGIVAIVVLTGISAFFSSSEIAVFSLGRHRVDALVAANAPGSAALQTLRADPHRFLVTALVSNNVANIAAAAVATGVLVQILPPSQAATGATVFTSVFVILFGEIAPKSYAVANAERHALWIAGPVVAIQRVIWPVLYVFEASAERINRLTGGESEFESYLTREEIETIVQSGANTGAIDVEESTMIRGVLDLEATRVRAVMVPRTEMVTLPETASLKEVIHVGARENVTRIPIYGQNRDDVVGIVDIRDAILAGEAGGTDGDTEPNGLEELITEPVFVPETKPVDELLAEMQAEGAPLVLVVDEFGAVTGLATIEDAIEEVVGEIIGRGETDPIRIVDEHTAIAAGWTTIAYLNETLDLALPTDSAFDTLAGLIHHHTGRLASEGDRVELATVTLEVIDATATRIRRVRVEKHDDGE